jgi:hypothetical protein
MAELLESTDVEIDGFTYSLTALDAVKARKVLFKVTAALVPTLQALANAKASPELAVVQAATSLVENLPEATYSEICAVFAQNTVVTLPDGRKPLLKDVAQFHFSRRLSAEARWLFECCKFNFADFLGGKALGDLRALIPIKLSQSSVPKS